ncbi:hypothetical protein [Hyphomicrobium sp.]|uniref:hypothetical protein n=1 Tax=Hyphomicrobium sp. TaxID=82 RepID=UPI002E349686|nr:hypothetical protein [Hyphomicrobium sp.]HEX2840344.1 hypothetical protein [Hyphomicrobium sp.]
MRHHRLTISQKGGQVRETEHMPGPDLIEAAQLRRLASTVLSKTPDDLAALAETNPMLIWEWIEAFRKERLAAEAEARYWSAAAAALSTANPETVRAAAE